MALDRGDPPNPGKYILKCSQWKSSGQLMCDLGRLELTVVTGQFGLLYRQSYRKVSKQACKQLSKQTSMQVGRHGSNPVLATYAQQGTC